MADENIIVRITGEADLSDAQAQVRELTQRNKELENEMRALATARKQDEDDLKAMGLGEKELAAALQKNTQYYKQQEQELQKVAQSNEKNIASLKKSVSQYNTLNGAGAKARQQLAAIREEMVNLAEAGDTSSERFSQLSERAAELQDTIGDAQQVIRLMASDTRNLDTAMAVGGGLISTFNMATSAMALLGGESEALQQAFLKVQAAMAVMNGLQQVSTVLNKRSAANIVLRTALQKMFNKTKLAEAVATGTATKAQLAFNAAVMANPVGLIIGVLATAAAGFAYFSHKAKEAKDEVKDYSEALQTAEDRLKGLNEQLDKRTPQEKWTDEIAENTRQIELNNEAIKNQENKVKGLQKSHLTSIETLRDERKALQDLKDWNTKLEASNTALQTLISEQDTKDADERAAEQKREHETKLQNTQSEFNARMEANKAAVEQEYQDFNNMQKVQAKRTKEEAAAKLKAYNDEKAHQEELRKLAEADAEAEMAYSDEVYENEMQHLEDIKKKREEMLNQSSEILSSVNSVYDDIMGIMSSQIQAEMDNLNKYYTTDAEEAKNDADKKYMSEKEYQQKMAELEMRQARFAKAQALVDIAIQTALAIIAAFARSGAVGAALAASTGAASLVAAAAKPLAQYEKGRSGGPGEFALVGEKGPELMYVPAGASIVPNNKLGNPGAWGAYGIPQLAIPATANVNGDALKQALALYSGTIDYERLGRAVADNIPEQKTVSVNVDRRGVTVHSGRETRVYLNTKYAGQWS